jgi:hypothetical protein
MSAAAAVALATPPAAEATTEGHYCFTLVPPDTDCAISPGESGDWWNGVIFVNFAHYPGEGTVNVCQHTYRRSNTETVSDTCANTTAESGNQLIYYYENNIELSAHAGNNSSIRHTIDGIVGYN